MEAEKGRNQTTLGIWMAEAVDVDPFTLVLDLEGNDGEERGQQENPQTSKDLSGYSSGWQSIRRMGRSRRTLSGSSADWVQHTCTYLDTMASDVSAPPSWKIVGVLNGLRLFKEAKSGVNQQLLYGPSALMTVGVVDGTPEAIFQTLMSLGPSRSEYPLFYYIYIYTERGH